MRECVQIAAEMLGKEVPGLLMLRLNRIDDLVFMAGGIDGQRGGALRSRQVVAMVIESWEREQGGNGSA